MWLTPTDWEKLVTPGVSIHERVMVLATRFCMAGPWCPTEPAVKNVVALAYLDQGEPSSFLESALKSLRAFKTTVKMHRVAGPTGMKVAMPSFEMSIADFKAKHEAWYAAAYAKEAPAERVPIDLHNYRFIRRTMGCRVSKTGLGRLAPAQGRAVGPAPSMGTPLTFQDLATFMANQQIGVAGPSGMAGLPGFRVCEPSSPLSPRSPLALPAPAEPPSPRETSPQASAVAGPLDAVFAAADPATPPRPAVAALEVAPHAEAGPAASSADIDPAVAAPAEAVPPATAPADLIAKFQGMLNEAVPNDEAAMKRPSAADASALVAEPKLKKAKTMLMKKPAASDKLPPGWDKKQVQRKSGASAGEWDTYYIAPWGKTYRSLVEVRAAIEKA